MKLNQIIDGLEVIKTSGNIEINIENVAFDSRKVTPNTLFICIKGFKVDGHDFIQKAIDMGAVAFLVEEDISIDGYTFIKVEDTRASMAKVADNFYELPSTKIDIIGVTGTNGKTSISTFLTEVLELNKNKIGLVGTIKIFDGEKEIESSNTTPESLDLQKYFKQMVDNNCTHCAMEVSSHSLVLKRVDEVDFKIGLFTNLTPDHLDFHKDLDDYRDAKEQLFYKTSVANIINIDDEGGAKIYENIKNLETKAYTYAIDQEADFMAKDIKIDASGVTYKLITPTYEEEVFVPVPGKFTVYNTLAVIAGCYCLGIDKEIILKALKNTSGVAGRFETVKNDKEISVIVDYAHTPDALENILNTAREFAKGNIITVFGCGGDRDTTKRPIMGNIAQRLSNKIIVTSDNPRTEDPELILKDIVKGLDTNNENYDIVIDRREAINNAVKMAKKGDVVIIAGKGHETYQILGTVKHHFDDKEEAKKALDNK